MKIFKIIFLIGIIFINTLYSEYSEDKNIEKILNYILNEKYDIAKHAGYQLLIETDSNLIKEKTNFFIGLY